MNRDKKLTVNSQTASGSRRLPPAISSCFLTSEQNKDETRYPLRFSSIERRTRNRNDDVSRSSCCQLNSRGNAAATTLSSSIYRRQIDPPRELYIATTNDYYRRHRIVSCSRQNRLATTTSPIVAGLCAALTASAAMLMLIVISSLTTVPGVSGAIACYRCQSRNNSNYNCDDPFHTFDNTSGIITNFLDRNCMGARKERLGPFPAVACIKVAGYVLDSGEWLTLRSCAGDSGETTSDTEIVRQNHCGTFRYENEYLRGCIMSCYEDGCNAGMSSSMTMNKRDRVKSCLLMSLASAALLLH